MSGEKQSIFVIEDDEDTRALLEFILNRAGFNVYLAIDGEAALNRISSTAPPSAVLLDILMPYHNGFEVLQAIKANKQWRQIPVIILTSKENEDDIVRGFKEGITDYVTKPFNGVVKHSASAVSSLPVPPA